MRCRRDIDCWVRPSTPHRETPADPRLSLLCRILSQLVPPSDPQNCLVAPLGSWSVRNTFCHVFLAAAWLAYSLSGGTPKSLCLSFICCRNSGVRSARPKPAVYVDGLQMFGIASFALEVALTTGSVNWAHIVWNQSHTINVPGPSTLTSAWSVSWLL